MTGNRGRPERRPLCRYFYDFPVKPLIFLAFYAMMLIDNISNRSKEWTKKSTLSFCITGIFRQKGGGNPWQEEMNMTPGSGNF